MELFFDTETTGMALFKESVTHPDQPHMVQLGLVLSDADVIHHRMSILVELIDWKIHPKAEDVHGISEDRCRRFGMPEAAVTEQFIAMMRKAEIIVCHNVGFDALIMGAAIHRYWPEFSEYFDGYPKLCTMQGSTDFCKIPGRWAGKYKWPKLSELHKTLFNKDFLGAHDALNDIEATRRCFYELRRLGVM